MVGPPPGTESSTTMQDPTTSSTFEEPFAPGTVLLRDGWYIPNSWLMTRFDSRHINRSRRWTAGFPASAFRRSKWSSGEWTHGLHLQPNIVTKGAELVKPAKSRQLCHNLLLRPPDFHHVRPTISDWKRLQTLTSSFSLDIGPVVWQTYVDTLGISWDELYITFATNCAGLAVGCIIFIPFAHKYGRRPVYIVSTIITFAMAIWQAKLYTFGEMVATQVISGLSGAVSETLVQITVNEML